MPCTPIQNFLKEGFILWESLSLKGSVYVKSHGHFEDRSHFSSTCAPPIAPLKCLPEAPIQKQRGRGLAARTCLRGFDDSLSLPPYTRPIPLSWKTKHGAASGRCAVVGREARLSGLSFFIYKVETGMSVSWKHHKDELKQSL